MDVRLAIWTTALFLSGAAILAMAVLIGVRIVRQRQAFRRQRIKDDLTLDVLRLCGGPIGHIEKRLSHSQKDILAEAGMDLLDLVQGEMSRRVAQVLAGHGIDGVLLRWLGSANPLRRAAAAEAMAHVTGPTTHRALDAALKDRDLNVRLAAAESLVKLGAAPPLNELISALGKQGTASACLGRIMQLTFSRHPNEVLQLAKDRALGGFIRAKAIAILAASGNLSLVPELVALTSDQNADVRTEALRGLGTLRHPSAADAISRAFADPAWYVRAAAAEAAGRIGLPELGPGLAMLAEDSVWWVRFRASDALAALDESGRGALRRVVASHRGGASEGGAPPVAERARA